ATRRFVQVLNELCGELPLLRQPAASDTSRPQGCIAQLMMNAVKPYMNNNFITPMAAVAGAVAENILSTMTNAAKLAKAYVNNGGDIALHLGCGEQFTIGVVDRPDQPSLF